MQEWATTGTDKTSSKTVGFHAGSVYRFNSDGLIKRDATYFDLLTPAVQSGKKTGEARPVPTLAEKPTVIVASGSTDDTSANASDIAPGGGPPTPSRNDGKKSSSPIQKIVRPIHNARFHGSVR